MKMKIVSAMILIVSAFTILLSGCASNKVQGTKITTSKQAKPMTQMEDKQKGSIVEAGCCSGE